MTPRPTPRSWEEEEEVGVSSCCGKRSACLALRVQLGNGRLRTKSGALWSRKAVHTHSFASRAGVHLTARTDKLRSCRASMAHRGRGLVVGPANAVIRTKKRSLACR